MKLLIVDDSKAMRMIVTRALRQLGLEDLTVDEAVDGIEALEKLRAIPYEVVLADWNMPRLNGFELLKTIKAESLAPHVGFITSEATADIKQLALAQGADFLIVKPFTADSLKDALRHLAST